MTLRVMPQTERPTCDVAGHLGTQFFAGVCFGPEWAELAIHAALVAGGVPQLVECGRSILVVALEPLRLGQVDVVADGVVKRPILLVMDEAQLRRGQTAGYGITKIGRAHV